MTDSHAVYHDVDSSLSTRQQTDLALSYCWEGDVARALVLIPHGDDADALLAQGVMGYWKARTDDGDYERAKDLLSQSARLFIESGERDRALLAGIWVGLCYWRQGRLSESYIILARSAEATDPHVQFLALVNTSVLHTERGSWGCSIRSLERAQEYFELESSLSWRGKFFQQRGLSYKQAYEETETTDYLDKALTDYEAASEQYEFAGNVRYEAAILNNLGNLYRVAQQFNRAHNNVDRAITLYERLQDRSHLAHAKDTKALIFLDEGQFKRAHKFADQAVGLLRGHDEGWLSVPLITRGKIFSKMAQISQAQRDFEEAALVAETSGDLKRAADAYLVHADCLSGYLSFHALVGLFAKANELDKGKRSSIALKIMEHANLGAVTSLVELKSAEHHQETEVILRALEQSKGSVTNAAKLIGKTHGGLSHIIKTRHPELESHCRPIVHRRKKI